MSTDHAHQVNAHIAHVTHLTDGWTALDLHIRLAIHHLRLYEAFSSDSQPTKRFFVPNAIRRLNMHIRKRNRVLAQEAPTLAAVAAIETAPQHGPMGVLVRMSRIGWYPGMYDSPGFAPLHVECAQCSASLQDHKVVSGEGDLHATWRCTACGSVEVIAIQAQTQQWSPPARPAPATRPPCRAVW